MKLVSRKATRFQSKNGDLAYITVKYFNSVLIMTENLDHRSLNFLHFLIIY